MKKEIEALGFKKGDGATITGLYVFIEQTGKMAGSLGIVNADAAKALKDFDKVKGALLKLAAEVDR